MSGFIGKMIRFFIKKVIEFIALLTRKSENPPKSSKPVVESIMTTKKTVVAKTIYCNGDHVPVAWDKVVTYREQPDWSLPDSNMKSFSGNRKPSIFVVHWDGCLDSEMCHRVIEGRGLSVHFCIDTDGTIIQLMDTNNIAWHARGVNTQSIGVEVANPVYMKYQDKQDSPRPVWPAEKFNGKTQQKRLGFYPIQEQALKVLIDSVCGYYQIPLVYPTYKGQIKDPHKFSGVIGHYHVTRNKTDPLGLDFSKVVVDDD